MRISTITNWAYATTVALTLLSGGAFIMAFRSADMERDAATTAWKLDEMVEQLQSAAEKTTGTTGATNTSGAGTNGTNGSGGG
ncbi:hypothetical protein ELH73_29730 [Rhizobium leguminosarum]|jgi:hypothetical protein|uniref:Uncharacterized protein n=2 Tax=Rhizobium leguminosarum TaxID=384 RepID=A0ABD7PKV8_RHILE|nr:hypothetical protein ELI28_28270 [Rhizobium leguminosarum]TAV65206.1 hypothetical protein ELI27_30805 [Rhizobium leguminosarum]TAW25195.1 hypothetical protein ELI19_27515 [Rhizobium leguminosarum]TAW38966.1 hypothetical protein ELI18_27485 [Rhizobium leguminosarum]TAZ25302.1 hypothetical protein ELH73_29730 [Rhizobium leguminosarum]